MSSGYRIGTGYDVHRLVPDRKLILGGVEIPWEKGLLGHSDADVLTHAVMDAMLGAAALGDIGQHFPDRDPAFEGISSLRLLEKCAQLLAENGFPAGYLNRKYRCDICKDTGYTDEGMVCSCCRQRAAEAYDWHTNKEKA